jgi:hypothetical protein
VYWREEKEGMIMAKLAEVLEMPLKYFVLRAIRCLAASDGPGKASFEEICDKTCWFIGNASSIRYSVNSRAVVAFDNSSDINEKTIFDVIEFLVDNGDVQQCNGVNWLPCYADISLSSKARDDLDPVAAAVLNVFRKIPKDQVAPVELTYIHNTFMKISSLRNVDSPVRKILDALGDLCSKDELIRVKFGRWARADGIHGYQKQYDKVYGKCFVRSE